MNKRLMVYTMIMVIVLLAGLYWKNAEQAQQVFSNATIKYGAQGEDVRELQGRLKFLGYFDGTVDGDFGYQTLTSLKRFQSAFGMKVDGIAGSKTKLKLWEATKSWTPGNDQVNAKATNEESAAPAYGASKMGLSEQDLKLMANAVYGEARGEPYEGQVAVAAVILNRVKSEAFPNSVSEVIFQPLAFTAVADGQIWLEPNEQAVRAVQDALNGWDPSGGCVYYFNPETATSKWIWERPQVKTIGKHIFCM